MSIFFAEAQSQEVEPVDTRLSEAKHPSLNDCINAVMVISKEQRRWIDEVQFGEAAVTHLGQALFLTTTPSEMPLLLSCEPVRLLSHLPGPGKYREQSHRCARVALQALALYSLSREAPKRMRSELGRAGAVAYILAAKASFDYNQWSSDFWWKMGRGFVDHAHIITASQHMLNK